MYSLDAIRLVEEHGGCPHASDDVFFQCSDVDSKRHTPLSMCSMSSRARGADRNSESSGRR